MPEVSSARSCARLRYLKSVAGRFNEEHLLDRALVNGWTPKIITDNATSIRRGSASIHINCKIHSRREAIRQAASRRYVSPEERATLQAQYEIECEARRLREAIAATDETRPDVPKALKPYRSSCRNMHDCDLLANVLGNGWQRGQLDRVARRFKRGKTITRTARRMAMALLQGKPAGDFGFLLGMNAA